MVELTNANKYQRITRNQYGAYLNTWIYSWM